LLEQLALTLEELETNATEDELAEERAVANTTTVNSFTHKRPERNGLNRMLKHIIQNRSDS